MVYFIAETCRVYVGRYIQQLCIFLAQLTSICTQASCFGGMVHLIKDIIDYK